MAILVLLIAMIMSLAFLPVVLVLRASQRPKPESFLDPLMVEGRLKRKTTAGPPLRALLDPEHFVRLDAPGVSPLRDLPFVGDERGYNSLRVGYEARFVLAKHPTSGALCVVRILPIEGSD